MMNQAMTERVDMLEKWIQESNNVVFLCYFFLFVIVF